MLLNKIFENTMIIYLNLSFNIINLPKNPIKVWKHGNKINLFYIKIIPCAKLFHLTRIVTKSIFFSSENIRGWIRLTWHAYNMLNHSLLHQVCVHTCVNCIVNSLCVFPNWSSDFWSNLLFLPINKYLTKTFKASGHKSYLSTY